jgi:hypothetical protein
MVSYRRFGSGAWDNGTAASSSSLLEGTAFDVHRDKRRCAAVVLIVAGLSALAVFSNVPRSQTETTDVKSSIDGEKQRFMAIKKLPDSMVVPSDADSNVPHSEDSRVISPMSDTGALLGGDADVHGCRPSAGYSWCEKMKLCIRPWEWNIHSIEAFDRMCRTTASSAEASGLSTNSTGDPPTNNDTL